MYQIKYVTCRFLFLVKTTIIYWRAWHIEHNIAHLHSTARHNMPKFKKEKRRDYLALDRQPWPSVLGIATPMRWQAETRRTYWNLNNVTISQFTPISQSPSSQYSSWAIFTKTCSQCRRKHSQKSFSSLFHWIFSWKCSLQSNCATIANLKVGYLWSLWFRQKKPKVPIFERLLPLSCLNSHCWLKLGRPELSRI